MRPWQSLPVGTRKRGEAVVVTSSHSGDRLRTLRERGKAAMCSRERGEVAVISAHTYDLT